MHFDQRGLSLSAASSTAAQAFDYTVEGYLSMRRDTGDRLKALFGEDPDMPMAHVLKAYFCMLMATGGLRSAARKAAAEAQRRQEAATPRERLHIDAADHWVQGRTNRAIACWEAILAEYPTDILALRLAHHGHFYSGDDQNLRDTVARRLHAWDESVPGYGYVLGMLSFGLEETHNYADALAAGHKAVEQIAVNPWAIHAVAHVHESQGTSADGIAWIKDTYDGWESANGFRYHVWWHRILMHLSQGDYDTVIDLYDNALWDPDSDEYLDLVNDAALLLRLELHGKDVGDRWGALAEKCALHTNDQILAFVDVHYGIALGAARFDQATSLLRFMEAYSSAKGEDNALITDRVGVPLLQGVLSHRTGQFGQAVDLMLPIRYDIFRIGGSHAQRDLFAMVLIDSAIKSGRENVAKMLLSERLVHMPDDAWTTRAAATLGLAA